MIQPCRAALTAALLLGIAPVPALAQADSIFRSWNQPVAPARVIGDIYYVGASDVTSFLIRTDEGLIVIDGGFLETAPQILGNIRHLGFEPRDVELLLNNHAHFDHAGGLAMLKDSTGARVVASAADAALLEAGGRDDFQFGDRMVFPLVQVDSVIGDGAVLRLGAVALTAHLTPGHTKGCTTWTMTAREDGTTYPVAFLCSLSAPGYRLIGNPAYPDIAADFERTFRKVRELPCMVFLGSHGSFFRLGEKLARARAGARPSPFIDRAGCRAYIERNERAFRTLFEKQRDAEPEGAGPPDADLLDEPNPRPGRRR